MKHSPSRQKRSMAKARSLGSKLLPHADYLLWKDRDEEAVAAIRQGLDWGKPELRNETL